MKSDIEEMRIKSVEISRTNAASESTDATLNSVTDSLAEQAALSSKMTETQALHKQIKEMELELQRIRATHPPEQRMTVRQAEARSDQQIMELEELTEQCDRADDELRVVEHGVKSTAKENMRLVKDREREEARAKEVREGREAGDTRVDEICHW